MSSDQHTPPINISSEDEYQAALVEFESYFDNEPKVGSPEDHRFTRLGFALAEYEQTTERS